MRKVDTIQELRLERSRLKNHLRAVEILIENDVENIRESIQPVNLIIRQVKKTFTRTENGIVSTPLNASIEFILQKVLLRNSGFITKFIVPFIVKNMANNYYGEHKGDIIGWVGDKISNLFKKDKSKYYEKATADIDMED